MAIVADLTAVKAWMDVTDTSADGRLTTILNAVDAAFARELRRPILLQQRTEVIPEIVRFQRILTLDAAPINKVNSFWNDPDRLFAADSLRTDFTIMANEGVLVFADDLEDGIAVARCTYDGGMASDATDFAGKYPDIHEAALQQVQYEWQRRNTAGATSEVAQGANRVWTSQVKLLDIARQRLAPYRRIRIG